MKNKILKYSAIAVIATGLTTAAGVVGLKQVAAQNESGTYPTIVKNIADAFGLDPSAVQTVFDNTRAQEEETRLTQAVSDGKITEDQKTLILNKQKDIEAKIEEINNQKLTEEERRVQMDALRDEIRAWAEENNIPSMFLHIMGMEPNRHGGEHGMGFGMGEPPVQNSTNKTE